MKNVFSSEFLSPRFIVRSTAWLIFWIVKVHVTRYSKRYSRSLTRTSAYYAEEAHENDRLEVESSLTIFLHTWCSLGLLEFLSLSLADALKTIPTDSIFIEYNFKFIIINCTVSHEKKQSRRG